MKITHATLTLETNQWYPSWDGSRRIRLEKRGRRIEIIDTGRTYIGHGIHDDRLNSLASSLNQTPEAAVCTTK